MKIKQDPITGLWARSDGAVLMPPNGRVFKKFRWTFGCQRPNGYRYIVFKGKPHAVHRLVCRAFHGLPPEGKPFCDHKNRIKSSNFASNLHWVSIKENADNQASVDVSIATYGVRQCKDKRGYNAAYIAKMKAKGLRYCKDSSGKWGWRP